MPTNEESNTSFRSTTWVRKVIKVPAPPGGQKRSRSKSGLPALSALGHTREPINITVRYLGGSECWFSIRARGREWKRPGYVALYDLMRDIADGHGGRPPEQTRIQRATKR